MKVERGHRAYPTHSEVLVIWRPWWKRDLFIATPSSSTSSTLQLTDRQLPCHTPSASSASMVLFYLIPLQFFWPYDPVCPSLDRLVGLSVCLSVVISLTGGQFHFHAPVGALVYNFDSWQVSTFASSSTPTPSRWETMRAATMSTRMTRYY